MDKKRVQKGRRAVGRVLRLKKDKHVFCKAKGLLYACVSLIRNPDPQSLTPRSPQTPPFSLQNPPPRIPKKPLPQTQRSSVCCGSGSGHQTAYRLDVSGLKAVEILRPTHQWHSYATDVAPV